MVMASRCIDEDYKDLLLADYHTRETETEAQIWSAHMMEAPATPFERKEKPNRIGLYAVSPSSLSKKCSCVDPMEKVAHGFNKLSKNAENLASNMWIHLTTEQSVRKAAWGKVSLGAKALSKGGFKALFKQTFPVETQEKLRKTYACYLSTSTGPVAGTLYISTVKIAFCSDRPLSYKFPSGEKEWIHYRVAIPVAKVKAVYPSADRDDPAKKYIEVVTEDDHEFWFMGFIKYNTALKNLQLHQHS